MISLPFIIIPTVLTSPDKPFEIPLQIWAGFLYLALFSQLIGFFHGIKDWLWVESRVSARLSYCNLVITLFASFVLLGENIDIFSLVFCILVVITVAMGKRMPVYR